MLTEYDDGGAYLFEAAQMRRFDQIRLRLYAEKPLSGDERRDLANALDAVMHGAARMASEDFTDGDLYGCTSWRNRTQDDETVKVDWNAIKRVARQS